MQFQRINIITGWAVWLVATIVYVMTLEPTMPFWDCGEFIASVNKLEVGHPPGAPLFMLIGRVFAAFAGDNSAMVPYLINMLSAFSASFTILFLFWTITHMGKKLADLDGEFTKGKLWAVIGAGVIGSLVYTFSDSFWFSAVEAEVYAMSSLFTAIVFWAILKWESELDEGGSLRWIVFIAFMMGLSIGVHLLNLLAIPAICLVYYFKRYEFSWKGIILTGIISLACLWTINSGIIIYFVKLAGFFERMFVNTFSMPFNTGVIAYFLLLTGLIVFGVIYTHKRGWVTLNTLIVSVTVAIIGYSSFATVIIRSQANPPMDENNPENLFSLLAYLNREQYGDRPLLYGQYFNTPQDLEDPYKDGDDVWVKSYSVYDSKKNKRVISYRNRFEADQYVSTNSDQQLHVEEEYVESGEKKGSIPNYDKRFCGIFPRMHSNQANHIPDYKTWSDYQGWVSKGPKKVQMAEQSIAEYESALNYYSRYQELPKEFVQRYNESNIRSVVNTLDRMQLKMIPSTAEELRYFTSFQVGWMYMRYFMWNFAGRQNDKQGHGAFNEGNWLSGIQLVDEERLGNRDQLTELDRNNAGFNKYFFIPLVLGLIGLIFQLLRNWKDFSIVTALFVLTGLAIVVYLNQTPQQPRERDYAYSGSFYAFAIWIGLGVYALYHASIRMTFKSLGMLAAMTIGGSLVIYTVESLSNDSHGFSYALLSMSMITVILFAIATLLNTGMKGETMAKGLIISALALPAPYLLATENWDDHDRAGRETGLAMAINYLSSLEPNAIIFTNGDNDTFPLWYAQEVQGIRTDVRVVNLSLLNTDWYIDQQKRKAYESEPVPFKMPEIKYRQGTRDVMFLNNKEVSKEYIPVANALATLMDDSKFVDNGRNKIQYTGTHMFSIDVPAEAAEKFRGMLHEGDSLVTKIQWAINDANGKPKSYITKAQMMVLDLLANMDWNRPVYFAVTTGGDAYMGLERYFQLEGLAYRLTPILHKRSDNPNLDGGIGTDLMYRNMMERFTWGNMDTQHIYMDENNRRMTTNLRLQFNHLAEQLITEGRKEEALKVLDKSLTVMPESNVPYEQPQIMWQVADLLYQAGDSARAFDLTKRLHDLNMQQYQFYESVDKDRQSEIERDAMTAVQISDRLMLMAREYRPNDPFTKQMEQEVGEGLQKMDLQSYEVIMEQQRKYEEMQRMQEQMDSLRPKKLPGVTIGGDGKIIPKNP